MARRIRILVYEGSEEWLGACLHPGRAVVNEKVMTNGYYIKEAILPDEAHDEANLNAAAMFIFDAARGERVEEKRGLEESLAATGSTLSPKESA